ncbi:nicotinamide-nucleotide adenylyltransferase [Candidatus Micrarchaeota archaeon]|nr:nicotinamide-nucleotide adenylyltransferase [Candidatus Micrarchaeota archaeon]
MTAKKRKQTGPKRALFIGRFQPVHNGHLHAIKKLLKKYDEVVVVIGSSEDMFSKENPFTCGERIEMLRQCFSKADLARLILVPVPDVNDNRIWVDHVLSHIPTVHDVYSNNALVKMLFSQHGILVKSMDFLERTSKEGTFIRKLMAENDESWKEHVPNKAAEYLESIEADKRIRKIVRMG